MRACDGAELGELAVQDSRDRVATELEDLVEPVNEQGNIRDEGRPGAHNVRHRVHCREVRHRRGFDEHFRDDVVRGDPEHEGEAAEPDPLPLRPGEGGDRAGKKQSESAVPGVVGERVVQECVVPQVVADHPGPHHVDPDQALDLLLRVRGDHDLAEPRDRDDIEQACEGGEDIPVATDRAEAGGRVDADMTISEVLGGGLIPLGCADSGCDVTGFGQAWDHGDRPRLVDRLEALPIGCALVVGVRLEVDGEVSDVRLHDVHGEADPQRHAEPDRVAVGFAGVAFAVEEQEARHCGGCDHDGEFTEGEPADHWDAVPDDVGGDRDAADRPEGENRPVPPTIDLCNEDLRGEHYEPEDVDLRGSDFPKSKKSTH